MGETYWYAVNTPPMRERAACDLIRRLGFVPYLPEEEKEVRASGRAKRTVVRSYPIIPSYVFLELPQLMTPKIAFDLVRPIVVREDGPKPKNLDPMTWRRMRRRPGHNRKKVISSIVGIGGRPWAIPNSEIERMVEEAGEQRKLAEERRKAPFKIGDWVTVRAGPFEGFPAEVQDVCENRLKALLDVFGRKTLVDLGVADVAA